MSVIEQVRELTEGRAEEKAAAWWDLVALVADGDPDPDEVLAVLERLGKGADELQAAVSTCRMRRGLREDLAALPAKGRRAEELSAEVRRLGEELRLAQLRHDQAVAPLLAEREVLLRQAGEGANIRRALLESCPDKDLLDDLRSAERRLERQQAEARPLEAEADKLRERVRDTEEALKGRQPGGWAPPESISMSRLDEAELRERLAALRHRMAELERRVAPLRAAAARAASEINELTRRAMNL